MRPEELAQLQDKLVADGECFNAHEANTKHPKRARVLRSAGKATYMGKDLTELRSPHRELVPDRVGPGEHEPTFLRGIANKAKANKRHRFQNLYRCLNVEFLLWCWPQLHRDAAAGVDGVTAAPTKRISRRMWKRW